MAMIRTIVGIASIAAIAIPVVPAIAVTILGVIELGLDLAEGNNIGAAACLLSLFPLGKGIKMLTGIGGDAIKGGSKAKNLYKIATKGPLEMNLQKFGNAVGKTIFKSTDDAASVVAKNLNGTVTQLKNGWKVEIPNGRKAILVRVMNEGSGGRVKPYFRVSIDGKGSLNLDGVLSSDRALTHIDMTDDYLDQIVNIINKYLGK